MISKTIEKLQEKSYIRGCLAIEIAKGKHHKGGWFKKVVRALYNF